MIEPQTSNPAGTSRQPDDPLDAGVDNDADPFASMPPIVFGAEFDADNALAAIGPPPPAGAAPAELPSYVSGGAVAREFFDFYDDPTPPEWWPLGAGGFAHYRFGPRSVFGIGASGGRFKTVLVMQWLWHLLRKVPDLRAVVANAETDRWEIFAREVAAYAGVPLSDVIDKRGKRRHAARVDAARRDLARLDERVAWMDTDTVAPTLAGVAAIADATGARVVVIDYLQLFDAGVDPREREPMRAMMRDVVRIARGGGGRGVLVASAVTREAARFGGSLQSSHGGAYADHGWTDYCTLDAGPSAAGDANAPPVMLRMHKARRGCHGGKRFHDEPIECDGVHQRVIPTGPPPKPPEPDIDDADADPAAALAAFAAEVTQ